MLRRSRVLEHMFSYVVLLDVIYSFQFHFRLIMYCIENVPFVLLHKSLFFLVHLIEQIRLNLRYFFIKKKVIAIIYYWLIEGKQFLSLLKNVVQNILFCQQMWLKISFLFQNSISIYLKRITISYAYTYTQIHTISTIMPLAIS